MDVLERRVSDLLDSLNGIIDYSDRHVHREYGERALVYDLHVPPSVLGYCEIYTVNYPAKGDLWFYYKESDGGSVRSVGFTTKQEAERELRSKVAQSIEFWTNKVKWKENGDQTLRSRWDKSTPRPVVRCNGIHYTVGVEPLRNDRRDCLGHGGRKFCFRMLDSDEIITSHNVWYQGRIPLEFRDLLPDNAEKISSDGY